MLKVNVTNTNFKKFNFFQHFTFAGKITILEDFNYIALM